MSMDILGKYAAAMAAEQEKMKTNLADALNRVRVTAEEFEASVALIQAQFDEDMKARLDYFREGPKQQETYTGGPRFVFKDTDYTTRDNHIYPNEELQKGIAIGTLAMPKASPLESLDQALGDEGSKPQ